MNNQIITDQFNNSEVRIIMIDDEPWFVVKDLFTVLGKKSKSGNDLIDLDEDERGVFKIHTSGGYQDMAIVSESGMYFLILKSRKPIAKPFQKWVTKEILPSIRKTGSYSLPNTPQKFEPQKVLADTKASIELIREVFSCTPFEMIQIDLDAKKRGEVSPIEHFNIDLSDVYLLPTELGKLIGRSAIEVNQLLAKSGYQVKVNGVWQLTKDGREFGIELHGKFQQIKWRVEAVL